MSAISLNDRLNFALLSIGIITEDEKSGSSGEESSTDQDKDSTRFVHQNEVDRSPLLTAMTHAGHSVSSLARACGVEPSMISRLLREPKTNDPDESARNPSIQLAALISKELNTSPESLFSDIFDVKRSNTSAKHHKNSTQKTFN